MDRIHRRAVESLFELLESLCEGAITVDRNARITWISDKYRHLLEIGDNEVVVGRPIEDVIPNSLMRQVVDSGRPILLDVMRFKRRHFVVTRIPIVDDDGTVAGATGLVLYDRVDALKPLVGKFEQLNADLERARSALAAQRRTRYSFAQCVGASEAMDRAKSRARRAARSDSAVLLTGETGCGKEMFAQAIHAASARASRPFVAVNVAAVPEALMEAEFFGVAPGAYTGASRQPRPGKFEIADGGTLFLDEVGDMPLALQSKLLRVLQEREIEALGSNRVRAVDVRVIAASSRDLPALVEAGRFRADLYYRLNVLPVRIPPLRERLADLPTLCEVLLEQIAERNGHAAPGISRAALAALESHRWPGNVRELQNLLERCCALQEGDRIGLEDIRELLPASLVEPPATPPQRILPLREAVAEAERRSIREALRATGGQRSHAARLLGISRAKFYQRLERYGMESESTAGCSMPD